MERGVTAQPPDRRAHRFRLGGARRASVLASVVLPLLLGSCFPDPIPELWPPRSGEPRYTVDVVYRDWHTVVVLPRDAQGKVQPTPPDLAELRSAPFEYEEWEYCERGWYLEGRHGFLGIPGALRALCWPTASGVGQHSPATALWTRYAPEQIERWTFVVSEDGLQKLLAALESEKGEAIAGLPGWYEGSHSYHLFHHCHHFTASALRAAGLPIRPWWAFSAWLVGIQLDRVQSFHEDAGL